MGVTEKFTSSVFSGIAEFERANILECTCAGLDAARSRGCKGGRPGALLDMELKQARTLLADPEITIEDVARHLDAVPIPAGGKAGGTFPRTLKGSPLTDEESEATRTFGVLRLSDDVAATVPHEQYAAHQEQR